MANIITRKSVMTLFSSPTCAMSHAARFVLHEKAIVSDIEYYDPNEPPADLLELNPTGTSPTLIERDLVLYDSRIIMEYLDERFPHPPLHQMDPVSRATARMLIKRIDQDWYQLLDEIISSGEKKSAKAKKMLRESILSSAPIFAAKPFFMSDEFSLIDCAIAPLLWRLPSIGIDVSTPNDVITNYAQRIFGRPAFKRSLSEAEKEMAASSK
ncbi:stringent starvation protein A [Crenothrix polyspora]|uniref:Stringent starvation protein A n=2 Tax=Crenothrix polyspora TaxID=360316 RepID=A0A1R4H229_9GAMM|nr:glutathione S-transferase N-terminal domain-containing protein [Crenothrix polyspora]SJM90255.1 stringent starvation protein A [Crenothrix polyspora]